MFTRKDRFKLENSTFFYQLHNEWPDNGPTYFARAPRTFDTKIAAICQTLYKTAVTNIPSGLMVCPDFTA
jgi:hypothetical protein